MSWQHTLDDMFRLATKIGHQLQRNLSNHVAGQIALKAADRVIGPFNHMHPVERKTAEEIIQFTVRFIINSIAPNDRVETTRHEVERASETEAQRLSARLHTAFLEALQSRAISLGYDGVFGKIDRSGQIIVYKDIIKQSLISMLQVSFDEVRHG